MLLPVDVRQWLPVDHVVWLLLEVVERLDTSALHARAKLGGAGRAPYDPDMLLALLIYSYSGGLRSSRKIERRCREDVAFMVLTGLNYPDHVTISRFRQGNDAVIADLSDQVVVLLARAGLVNLEHVAIDGTKIVADASVARSRDVEGLRGTGRRWLNEAARVDEEEDALFGAGARGDELPEQLRDPQQRRKVIDELIEKAKADPDRKRARARQRKARAGGQALELADQAVADAEAKAPMSVQEAEAAVAAAEQRLAEDRAEAQARVDAYQQRQAEAKAKGRKGPAGRAPGPVEQSQPVTRATGVVKKSRARLDKLRKKLPQLAGKRNLTDPDARFMPVRGGGFILGYNAQLAVSADHVILAYAAVQDPNDQKQFQPMLARLTRLVEILREATGNPDLDIRTLLADAGYASEFNLTTPGPNRIIALGNRSNIEGDTPALDEPPEDASAWYKMSWLLRTPEARALYKKRGATVEPVNGHIKDARELRRFARRGLAPANAELGLAAITTNIMRLITTGALKPATTH